MRLLLLVAVLFALSPHADAGFGVWSETKYQVQMNGHPIGGWNGFKNMTKVDDNHYSVEFTPSTTEVMSFRIKMNGKEYGPTDDNTNTTLSEGYQQAWLTDYTNWGTKQGAWLINPSTGYKYTLHFWYEYGGKMQFNLEKTSTGTSGSGDVQLFGDFSAVGHTPDVSGWTAWSSKIDMNPASTGNTNEYVYSFIPTKTGKAYVRFNIGSTNYLPEEANSGNKEVYLEKDNWNHSNAKAKSYTGSTEWCWYLDVTDTNKVYTIRVRKDEGGTPRINASVTDKPWEGQVLPVFPEGVRTENELAAYNEWPVYYLQADVLNNCRVTPEYQMKKEGSKYVLTVTLRNTDNIYVEGFTSRSAKSAKYVDGTKVTNAGISGEGDLFTQKGKLYKVTFDPLANSGKGSLTFEDLHQTMPFLSMVGREWKQSTAANNGKPYVTPFPFTDDGQTPGKEEYEGKVRDTDFGWQEAWVQYEGGNLLKDRKGKVMYATMWPPKDNIKFRTDFKLSDGTVFDFTIESDALTLVPSETKKGSAWKTDPRFSKYANGTPTANFSGIEYADKLVLEDDAEYTLYRVDGMWINGDAKLWTGWGGYASGGGRYDSKWFANWGHHKALDTTTEINPGSTVPLFNEKGDMTFPEPTYFRYVNFFYKDSNPQGQRESVLFTEIAVGGAEIAAMSVKKENDKYVPGYEWGMYRPRLTNIQNITGKKITSVKITPWTADGSQEFDAVFVSDGAGKTVDHFSELFTSLPGMANNGNYWVYDPTEYVSGDYRYVMEVTVEGLDEPIVVSSNPFTIFRTDKKVTLSAYQLIQKKGMTNEYVTFADREGKAVYNVTEGANGQFTYTVFDGMPDYGDSSKYLFTDKVLLVGSIPSSDITDVSYADVDHPKFTDEFNQEGTRRYMTIVTSALGNQTYTLQMEYEITFFDADKQQEVSQKYESPEATLQFSLTVPEPKLLKARIEVFYGSDNTAATDGDTKDFTFRNHDLTNARYHNAREIIEIEEPNVTDALGTKMGSNKGFTYKLGGEQITLTNGKMIGKTMAPKNFYYEKIQGDDSHQAYAVKAVTKETSLTNVYPRWKDGAITGIKISDDAPNEFKHAVRNSALFYNEVPALDKNGNEVIENGEVKMVDNLRATFEILVKLENTIDNVVTHKDKDNGDLTETLLHHGDNDYFYVTIVDKDTEEIVKDAEGNPVEFVATDSDLRTGKVVKFQKDYGHWYDGQLEAVQKNPYYKQLGVRVSHLYPFNVESASGSGMSRSAADHTGDVIKSKSEKWTSGEIPTSVEGIEGAVEGSVKVGVGFIEATGNGVEIYSAEGVKVAAGEGRHDLNAGVYVVRFSGRVQKVIVR